jgi:FMN phosphatase YigB (HAD superfamily)
MAVAIKHKRYKVLIFDLDDTLFDSSSQCVGPAMHQSFESMIEAGLNATIQDCEHERISHFQTKGERNLPVILVEKFGLRAGSQLTPDEVVKAGREAFQSKPLGPISLYPMAREILSDLNSRYLTFLVTLGEPIHQKMKVQKLKIGHLFKNVFYVDSEKKQTKQEAFGMILIATGVRPDLCLSVGNRLDLEISESKAMGMDTCFVHTNERHREHPLSRDEQPDYKIARISEIMKVCQL